MAKFENTLYSKLWDSNEGRQILSSIIKNENLIRSNHMFWASKFRVDPNIVPTDAQGRSTFISTMRPATQGALMDMRSPMSHNTPAEVAPAEFYTGTIPSFSAKEFVETASERMYKEKLFEEYGDARLIAQYASEVVQRFADSGNQTLSHMAAELLSTGRIVVNWGEGIKGNVIDANVPSANRLKAGSAVWSDTTFLLLSHLRDLKETLDNRHGEMGWQLEITRSKFNNTFLKNAEVISWVKAQYAIDNGVIDHSNLPAAVVSTDYAVTALNRLTDIPAIVIIDEKQNDVVLGTVSGWNDKWAVVRPSGYAGYIRHSQVIEPVVYGSYGARGARKAYATLVSGLGTMINTELDNGELREWHSEFIMNAIPSLDEFLYHYIIDTTTADE